MSNAMLEAMASGLPVVTSRCEGVRELIADNGMVVDCDARAFAQAVKRLIFEIDFGLYSRASRARALEFGWAGAAREYRKIYDNVAGPGAWQR